MEEKNKDPIANIPAPQQADEIPKKKSRKGIYYILLLAFLILASIVYISKSTPSSLQKELSLKPAPTPLFLAVDSPKTETTAVQGEVLIEGRTLPSTIVAIYSDTDGTSLQSDSKGNFKDTVIVGDRGGLVRITAFSDNGAELSKTFDIGPNVLGRSDVERGESQQGTRGTRGDQKQAEKNQSQAQNQVVETDREKDSGVKSKKSPSVSDFLENKVKIEKPEKIGGKKMTDLLSEEGTTSASSNKHLKLEKMETKETSNGAQLKRHAITGVIIDISNGVITLAHQIHRERTYIVYYNNSTEISMKDNNSSASASLSSGLSVGMRIAVVGIPTDTGLIATRIHVIPGKAIGVFKKQPIASISATPAPSGTGSATPTATLTPTKIPATPSPTTTL